MKRIAAFVFFLGLIVSGALAAPVAYNSSGEELYKRFHRPGGLPLGTFDWVDGVTFPGWFAVYVTEPANAAATATVPPQYRINDGLGVSPIGLYCFRPTANFEYGSLGTRHFNATSGPIDQGGIFFGTAIRNQTGVPMESFRLGYTGEQWRVTGAAPGTLGVSFSTNATSLVTGNWAEVPALAFVSPRSQVSSDINANGKAEANRVVVTPVTVTLDPPLPPGGVLWLRWFSVNVNGIDQSIGIDEVRFTGNPQPHFNNVLTVGVDADPYGRNWNYTDRMIQIGAGAGQAGLLRVPANTTFRYYDLYLGTGAPEARGILEIIGPGAVALSSRGTGFGSVLHVGEDGKGAVSVREGGRLTRRALRVGVGAESEGVVTVAGSGSVINAPSGETLDLRIGELGQGLLTISDGGAVRGVANLWVGERMVVSEMEEEAGGDGTVVLANGGFLGATGGGHLGVRPGTTGAMEVAASAATIGGALQVGLEGQGDLIVTLGGQVDIGGALEIGAGASGRGLARVSGSQSRLTAGQDVRVGENGAGKLEIFDGARVEGAGRLLIGAAGGAGSVTVGGVDAVLLLQGELGLGTSGATVASARSSEPGAAVFIAADRPAAAKAGAPGFHFPVLRHLTLGFRGETVEALQTVLSFLGFNPGAASGIFGRETEMALRSFQASRAIPGHGELDLRTLVALQTALQPHGGYFLADRFEPVPDAGLTTLTMSALRPGTAFETPIYTFESPNPGPTFVMVGGIHGNELSGHLALVDAIEGGITLSRGRLVLVPSFNRIAVEQFRRTLNMPSSALHNVDFNRMFPEGGEPTYAIAREIWALIESQPNLAFVFDFHDGFVNGLGNSLLRTNQPEAIEVARMLAAAMEEIRPEDSVGTPWVAHDRLPIENSLIRKVGQDMGYPGILIELSGRTVGDPVDLRKDYSWRMVRLLGHHYGTTIGFTGLGMGGSETRGEGRLTVQDGGSVTTAGDLGLRGAATLRLDGGSVTAGGALWAEESASVVQYRLHRAGAAGLEVNGLFLNDTALEVELAFQPALRDTITLVANQGSRIGGFSFNGRRLEQGDRFEVVTGDFAAGFEMAYDGGPNGSHITITAVEVAEPENPFRDWIDEFGALPPEQRDPWAEPAGDGIANALKFVLNLDPLADGRGALPRPRREGEGENGFLILDIPINPAAISCCEQPNLRIERSEILEGEWQPVEPTSVEMIPGPTMRVRLPLDEEDRGFLRLRVDPEDFR